MIVAGGICIGFAPIGLRLGLDDLGPQAIAFWRYVFALPILFALACIANKGFPRKPNRFVVLAGICFTCNIALWHWGLEITSVANATFLVNCGNALVGFAAWLFLGERPARIWFFAILIALSGAAILTRYGTGTPMPGASDIPAYYGDLLAVAAAVFVGLYMLSAKLACRTLRGLETIFWITAVEICVAALFVLGSGESFMPQQVTGFQIPLFLALAVQVAGQGLIVVGLGKTPAGIAGLLVVVQPVVAAAAAWLLFSEPLTIIQICGAMLILSGIWLVQQGRPTTKTYTVD